ncbi:hypothetical protein ABI59_00550 [Acidobacteria bacterium Mor1]|nr:hypothetical protein ABI59_00550 [Acidobacteria bacterium Mor1]
MTIQGPAGSHAPIRIAIPRQERFRADEILGQAEYALPTSRSHGGPLTVIDAGANVGLFALYMKFVDPQATVHCFEPVPTTLGLLEHNVGSLSRVHVHPFALGQGEREVEITLSRSNTGANSFKGTCGDPGEGCVISCRDAAAEFDALGLDRLDVLKVDTEGCEVEILESLGDRLDAVDYVLLEYHSDDDRRRLDALLPQFKLFACSSRVVDCGVVKYMHRRLLGG